MILLVDEIAQLVVSQTNKVSQFTARSESMFKFGSLLKLLWPFGKKESHKYWVMAYPTGGFGLQVDGDSVPAIQVTEPVLNGIRRKDTFTPQQVVLFAGRYYFLEKADCQAFLAICEKICGDAAVEVPKSGPTKSLPKALPKVHRPAEDDEAAIAATSVPPLLVSNEVDFMAAFVEIDDSPPLPISVTGPAKVWAIVKSEQTYKVSQANIASGKTYTYATDADIAEARATGDIRKAVSLVFRDKAQADAMFAALKAGKKKKRDDK